MSFGGWCPDARSSERTILVNSGGTRSGELQIKSPAGIDPSWAVQRLYRHLTCRICSHNGDVVRSYFVTESIADAEMSGRASLVRSVRGEIYFERRSYWTYQGGWSWERRAITFDDEPLFWNYQWPASQTSVLGFGSLSGMVLTWPGHLYLGVPIPANKTDPRWWRDNYSAMFLPYWAFVAAFGLLPTRWLMLEIRRRRLQRNLAGRCAGCGYDLRATPDRCPECGTVPGVPTVHD